MPYGSGRLKTLGWMVSLMALTIVGCSSPSGQTCERDSDCERGYQCVSTGGLVFGDSLCLVSQEAVPDSGDETDAGDATGGAVDADTDVSDTASPQDTSTDSDTAGDTDADEPCSGLDADGCESDGCQPTNGGEEICDGIDNDCDGEVDEGVQTEYFYDSDGDGYGIDDDTVMGCNPVGNYAATEGNDCDDGSSDINPGAEELCSPDIDYDCDADFDCEDSDCDGEACLDNGAPGTCQGGTCVESIGECEVDRDCNLSEYCRHCPGPNYCCPDDQLCPCRERL